LGPLNLTSLDLSQAGSIGVANGIKSAVLGASAWYFPYVIYNGTTIALWLDTSPSAPTLPTGYTHWAKFNGLKTDASSHFLPIGQTNDDSTYKNTGAGHPVLASGPVGSVSTPTWVATSVRGGAIPSTAKNIIVGLWVNGGARQVIVAPNANYGAATSSTNPPMVAFTSSSYMSGWGELTLESDNIYCALDSGCVLFCLGWKE